MAMLQVVTMFLSDRDMITALATTLIVFLLGAITLSTAEIRHDLRNLTDSSNRAVHSFHSNRSELPSFEERFRSCSDEIYLFGLQLGSGSMIRSH
jgi:hypothetical protein